MKKIFAFIFFALFQLQTYANYEIPEEIPTPNAASLGSYGIIPVSLYTGKPNISIPLYTFEYKGFSLPVSLNYDASGVNVNELPGWMGHNWTVNAGGVITRSVRGEIDEYNTYHPIVYNRFQNPIESARLSGDYHCPVRGYPNYFKSYKSVSDLYKTKTPNGVDIAKLTGLYDLSPDIFFFNFLNYSGCFFLGHDGEWKVQSESNLDIVFDISDPNNYVSPFLPKFVNGESMEKTIKGFTIRDENGYSYEFGGTTDAIDYATPFYDMGQWDAMSWYLTRILDKFGNELYTFEYERGKYIVQIHSCEEAYKKEYVIDEGWKRETHQTDSTSRVHPIFSININSPVYLKKIRANNGVVGIFESCDNEDKDENGDEYMSFNRLYRKFSNWFYETDGRVKPMSYDYLQYFAHEIKLEKLDTYMNLNRRFVWLTDWFYEQNKHELRYFAHSLKFEPFNHLRMRDYSFFYLLNYRSNQDLKNRLGTDYLNELQKYQYYPVSKSNLQIIYAENDIFARTRLRKLNCIYFTEELESKYDIYKGIGYQFQYSYCGRMHLDKITIGSAEDVRNANEIQVKGINAFYADRYNIYRNLEFNPIGAYRFRYNGFEELPEDYMTTSDAWGYYNGDSNLKIREAGYREAVPYYAKLGSLEEIQYPTGGTTVFEYELNQYGHYLSDDKRSIVECENRNCGGLRIASIVNWDSPRHNKILGRKTYSYTLPGSNKSSGIITNVPRFVWHNWQGSLYFADNHGAWFTLDSNGDNLYTQQTIMRNGSIIPLVNSFGPNLAYSSVTETNLDGSYTINRFSNVSDSNLRDERFFHEEFNKEGKASLFDIYSSNKSFMRGKLLLSSTYDSNGGKVKSTGYVYRAVPELNDKYEVMNSFEYELSGVDVNYLTHPIVPGIGEKPVETVLVKGGLYKAFYSRLDLQQINDTVFESNGNIVTRTDYTIDDQTLEMKTPYRHLTDIRLTTGFQKSNQGESYMETYGYSFDTDQTLYKEYFDIIPTSVKTYHNSVLAKTTKTVYVKDRYGHYLPSKEQEKIGANGIFKDKIVYTSYNGMGNLETYNLNGMTVTQRWDEHGRIRQRYKGLLKQNTQYKYDNLFGLTDIVYHGTLRSFDYDNVGRLVREDAYGKPDVEYDYNYRDLMVDTLASKDAFIRTPKVVTVSVGSGYERYQQTKDFTIAYSAQQVEFHVRLYSAVKNANVSVVISSSNNTFSKAYHLDNPDQDVNESFTARLEPGTYMISATMDEPSMASCNDIYAMVVVNYEEVRRENEEFTNNSK